jgi:signal transduction histidine kinase
MEIWTVWDPVYRAEGALKLLTGLVSFATTLSLIWIMPRAILLQTPRQLQIEVAARTAELADVNAQLRAEIAARVAAEEQLRLADRRKDEFLATLAHELRNPPRADSKRAEASGSSGHRGIEAAMGGQGDLAAGTPHGAPAR